MKLEEARIEKLGFESTRENMVEHSLKYEGLVEKINDLEKEIRSELEQLRVTAPSESEIARAKNRIESYYVMQMEKIGGFGGRADQLNYYIICKHYSFSYYYVKKS